MIELIKALIVAAALAHGVNPDIMLDMARCESTFNPYVVNRDDQTIQGLYQIKYPGGEGVTFYKRGYTNRFDPAQSANFTAERIVEGAGGQWDCYNTAIIKIKFK